MVLLSTLKSPTDGGRGTLIERKKEPLSCGGTHPILASVLVLHTYIYVHIYTHAYTHTLSSDVETRPRFKCVN